MEGFSATFIGRLKLRNLKGSSQAHISLFGGQVFAENAILKLKDGYYRKIVAELEPGSRGLFLKEIIEAYE